jgi:hypothetical protein
MRFPLRANEQAKNKRREKSNAAAEGLFFLRRSTRHTNRGQSQRRRKESRVQVSAILSPAISVSAFFLRLAFMNSTSSFLYIPTAAGPAP